MKILALILLLWPTVLTTAWAEAQEEAEAQLRERLVALPYLAWSPVQEETQLRTGAYTLQPEAVTPGVNLYGTAGEPAAYLTDNQGVILHRWAADTAPWHCYKPTREGDLYAIAEGGTLLKVNWNSELLWSVSGDFHHDLAIAPDGTLYIIRNEYRTIRRENSEYFIVDNLIDHRHPDGTRISQFSLYDLLASRLTKTRLENLRRIDRMRFKAMSKPREPGDPFEILHANTVEVITRPVASALPGDLLITLKHWNRFFLIRPAPPTLLWWWGRNDLKNPHGATLAPEGIMYFNNNAVDFVSAAGLMDPKARKKIWGYTRENNSAFYTASFGFAQPLGSGNVLITISEKGYVTEVTRRGETVWEFWNPEFSQDGSKRGRIERMTRYPEDFFLPLALEPATP